MTVPPAARHALLQTCSHQAFAQFKRLRNSCNVRGGTLACKAIGSTLCAAGRTTGQSRRLANGIACPTPESSHQTPPNTLPASASNSRFLERPCSPPFDNIPSQQNPTTPDRNRSCTPKARSISVVVLGRAARLAHYPANHSLIHQRTNRARLSLPSTCQVRRCR